jgi:hypothetical protein
VLATLNQADWVNVVHDGTQWIVTWYPWFLDTADGFEAARVTPDGTLRDPGGVHIPSGTGETVFAGSHDGRFVVVREVTTLATPGHGTRLAATWVSITGDNPDSGGSQGYGRWLLP